MLILKVMPDVSNTLCLLCFVCNSSHGVWWNPFWRLIIRVMSWNIHVIYGTCEWYICCCSKNKRFPWHPPKRTEESWNETAWNVHIAQVVERNIPNINMASLHTITLNSPKLFKVWNAPNVIEMNHKKNNNVWRWCWQYIDSHTHKSNFMLRCMTLSITWKLVFHYWLKPPMCSNPVRMTDIFIELYEHMH